MGGGRFAKIDDAIVNFAKNIFPPLARIAIFTIFFWFGFLKVIGVSPAGPLVENLLGATATGVPFEQFYVLFGLYEMAVGIAFAFPGLERIAVFLLVPHMITTALPLLLLPDITWASFLVPTLEGQYIIKNLAIVALAAGIGAQLHSRFPKDKL